MKNKISLLNYLPLLVCVSFIIINIKLYNSIAKAQFTLHKTESALNDARDILEEYQNSLQASHDIHNTGLQSISDKKGSNADKSTIDHTLIVANTKSPGKLNATADNEHSTPPDSSLVVQSVTSVDTASTNVAQNTDHRMKAFLGEYRALSKQETKINRVYSISRNDLKMKVELVSQNDTLSSVFIQSASLASTQKTKFPHFDIREVSFVNTKTSFVNNTFYCTFEEIPDDNYRPFSDLSPIKKVLKRTFNFEGTLDDTYKKINGKLYWDDISDDNSSLYHATIPLTLEIQRVNYPQGKEKNEIIYRVKRYPVTH